MMTMTSLPPAIIFIIGAILLPLLPHRVRSAGFLVFPLLAFALITSLESGTNLTLPFLNYNLVVLRVDRLSLAFGYIFIIIAFVGGVYSFHLKDRLQQAAALLYAGGALGVTFAGDLLTLFVFWEIMTVSSVCLIWARRTDRSNRAGMRYIIVHFFGGSVLLAGILWHLTETGSILFNHFEGGIASYLILFGFSLNAAIPPIHGWLADAYPEGTVTGTIFLSAFTTKVAVYTLARGFAGLEVLIWTGAIMAIYGVIFAVLENDIRRLLSYHIISQVGYMVAGVGIGTEMAINGATAHAFAHILYKALVLMGTGTVLYSTGRSKLTELGGLARRMPLTLALYMVGALSISGFPLFSGFVSRSMTIHAAELSHMGTIVLLLNVASVGTVLHTGLKLPYFTWFGTNRSLKPAPVPLGMHLGMALAAVLCLAIGTYPTPLYNLLPFPVDYHPYTATHLMETMQLLVFSGFGFWLLISKLGGTETITLDTDWVYRRPARLAYRCCVVSISRLFALVESLVIRLTHSLIELSCNPTGCVLRAGRCVCNVFSGTSQVSPEPAIFDPNRYRLQVEVMVLLVLLGFVILVAWKLLS